MRIVWNPCYEIGIDVIDNQHRSIVDYINGLDCLCREGVQGEALNQMLYDLVDYTHSHFAFEETLMEEAKFANLTEHQHCHQQFARQINDIRQRFDSGASVASELIDLLERWLLNHIMTDDVSYAGDIQRNLLGQQHAQWIDQSSRKFFKM